MFPTAPPRVSLTPESNTARNGEFDMLTSTVPKLISVFAFKVTVTTPSGMALPAVLFLRKGSVALHARPFLPKTAAERPHWLFTSTPSWWPLPSSLPSPRAMSKLVASVKSLQAELLRALRGHLRL